MALVEKNAVEAVKSTIAHPPKSRRSAGSRLLISLPYLWLLVFFLVPFFIVFKVSLSDYAIAIPPYVPTLDFSGGLAAGWESLKATFKEFDLENYQLLIEDSLYWKSYLNSITIAAIATLVTLIIGYPIAYGIARSSSAWRPTLLMLIILPFWTSFLIRVYAWIGILKKEGLLNLALGWIGVEPVSILNTDIAVYIGIIYSYLPFMVLPLYATLERMDDSLVEAARDLGCTAIGAFWKITFRLSLPGIIAGCFLVFIPTVGEFVIPDLLGSDRTPMIGKVMWVEFFSNRDWPASSAVAVILLLALIIPIVLFQKIQEREQEAAS